MDQLRKNIGSRLKTRRKSLKLSLKACANQSGLSVRYLIQVEAGEANLSLTKLMQLSQTLDLRLTELVSDGRRGRIDGLLSRLTPTQLDTAYELLQAHFKLSDVPRISLLGVRGAGKSSIGRSLALALGWRCLELDEIIESLADLTLSEIFTLHGESYYRRLEREALISILDHQESIVIATGGSIVTSAENFSILKKVSTTIWLQASAEDHWQRVILQGDRRPMRDHPHAMSELRTLLHEREPLYATANFNVDTHDRNIDEVTHHLLLQLMTLGISSTVEESHKISHKIT